MNIFVCIRQVPDTTTRIKLREDRNGIDESDIQWIISPPDSNTHLTMPTNREV